MRFEVVLWGSFPNGNGRQQSDNSYYTIRGGWKAVIIRSRAGSNDLIFARANMFNYILCIPKLGSAESALRCTVASRSTSAWRTTSMATVPSATTSNNGEQQDVVLQILHVKEVYTYTIDFTRERPSKFRRLPQEKNAQFVTVRTLMC